jgi:hypothetical protein
MAVLIDEDDELLAQAVAERVLAAGVPVRG